MMSPLILWAALVVGVVPPGTLAVVERGVASEHAHALAELVRARARVTWGAEALAEPGRAARYTVELTAMSAEACALVVRDEGGPLASRVIAWEAADLGLLEGWLVVRSTLERALGAEGARTTDATPDIPPQDVRASDGAAATTTVAAAEAASIPALGQDGGVSEVALEEPPVAVLAPAARAPELGLHSFVDTWGVVFLSQLAGAPSAGIAVQARKHIAPRVVISARVGLEWSTPVEGVSATRVPLIGMVGWSPWDELPVELGAQVQLAPVLVSTTDDNGGLGLTASVGGYGRAAWALGPVGLFGELGLAIPLGRQSYASATEAARDPALDFRISVGAEWRWP